MSPLGLLLPTMSGLEPLVAFSLACAVCQAVSFAGETLRVCRNLCSTGSAVESTGTQCLTRLCADLQKHCTPISGPLTREQQRLLDVAQTTIDAATKLERETTKIYRSLPRSKVLATPTWAARCGIYKCRRARLEKTMAEAQKNLETCLLVSMW